VQMKDFQWNERFVLHTKLQIKCSSGWPTIVFTSKLLIFWTLSIIKCSNN
jgi:hypothetical protein